MGILDAFRLTAAPRFDFTQATVTAAAMPIPVTNLYPSMALQNYVTYPEAMTVPAVARARNIICGTGSSLPLCTWDPNDVKVINRGFIDQPDPALPRINTMAWTISDLLFHGVAYWQILATYAEDGRVMNARRMDPMRVSYNTNPMNQTIIGYHVDGNPVPDQGIGSLIVFFGLDEGILARGGRTIRTAIELESAAYRMAQEPAPLTVLRNEGINLPQDQKDSLMAAWKQARQTRSTAYLEGPITMDTVGFDSAQMQLTEARAYTATEIARMCNIPGWYLNAESAQNTYSNVVQERRSLIDFSLRPYLSAIEDRLSMNDITPRGQEVEFELDDFLRGNATERVDVTIKLLAAGIISIDEARAMEDLAPRGTPVDY